MAGGLYGLPSTFTNESRFTSAGKAHNGNENIF